MPASHGKAVYDAKYITREVNGKPSTKSVEGSERSGFFYSMSWTGERYEKMFTCANKKPFDKQLLTKMVEYAKVIDKDAFDTP